MGDYSSSKLLHLSLIYLGIYWHQADKFLGLFLTPNLRLKSLIIEESEKKIAPDDPANQIPTDPLLLQISTLISNIMDLIYKCKSSLTHLKMVFNSISLGKKLFHELVTKLCDIDHEHLKFQSALFKSPWINYDVDCLIYIKFLQTRLINLNNIVLPWGISSSAFAVC